jgi:Legionella pneumophila major outer membrane protein precursor
MANFFKKIGVVMTFLLMPSISYVQADCQPTSNCDLLDQCSPCPSFCDLKGFISADLLYWRAFESGLDTCVPTKVCERVSSDGRIISKFSGKGHDPHFEWNPGFRLGAGYTSVDHEWDAGAFWTHFYSRAHRSNHNGNHVHWNIKFNVVDLIAGYKARLNPCFALRPFGGLRLARIKQRLHIGNFSDSGCSCVENNQITIDKRNKEKFSGIGPVIGLEADLKVGCGFSLYTNVSISWLYGHFHNRLTDSSEFIGGANFCKIRKKLDANLAVTDAGLGIRWHTCFCDDMRLLLQVGLEHHRYYDYNRMGNCGDLSFDGLNFAAGIEF